MILHRRKRVLGFFSPLEPSRPILLAAAILAGISMTTRAEIASPSGNQTTNESAPQARPPAERVITFDNAKGTATLEFRENLRQRQCVATVTPDVFTLAPGETAQIRIDARDSQPSGCLGEPKHVMWTVASLDAARSPLSYQVLFSVEPKMDDEGRVRIASTRFSRPGTPYAAICGSHACLDEWVPLSGSNSTVFLYHRE